MIRPGRSVFVLFLITLSAVLPLRASDTTRQLTPYYRHWIEEEIPYIISVDERREFLALHSDIERENFIQAFWDARNPTLGADYNIYKEEYYRRLTYASEHFGSMRYQDGWRTERGHMYIVLGPPKSTQTYHLTANIRDLEIWFYQSSTPALPSFFNIVFFRPGAGEEYKIYSPRHDGPYRLVTTGQQNNQAAMRIIQQQLGPELAHAALSLIPSEPVDLDSGEPPSMTSDLMLGTIRSLADNPLEKERINLARMREKATSSIIVAGTYELEPLIVADARGRLVLSYLLRDQAPDPTLIGEQKDGRKGYSLALRTSLFTRSGALIYEQQNQMQSALSATQATAAAARLFAAEDRLPVLPGEYDLEVSLRNDLTHQSMIFHGHVAVPQPAPGGLSLSSLIAYNGSAPMHDASLALPFSISGLRFAPRAVDVTSIAQGSKLPLVFQLHLPPATPAAPHPATVHLSYIFGLITGGHDAPTEVEEDVSTDSADPAGNILTGRTLDTIDLTPGTYRVVVRATAQGMTPGSSALKLKVVPASTPTDLWTAYGPEPRETYEQDDVKRGLIAAAQGHLEEAARWYLQSLREFENQSRSLNLLAATLSQLSQNEKLADLASQRQFARAADPATVLLVADALQTTGAGPQAIALIEAQLGLQPPDASLLNALAGYYSRAGKEDRAKEYRDRARALAGEHKAAS